MTEKGRYRDAFSAPPEPPLSPSSIGPRVLQTQHQGRTRTVVVDPTAFTCGRLVAELAGAIADRHAALDLSWGVLQRAERAARSFADWIDANHERLRDTRHASRDAARTRRSRRSTAQSGRPPEAASPSS